MTSVAVTPVEEIERLNKCVLEMIVEDMLPFDIVEKSGFQNMIKVLNPRYTLPTLKMIECTLIPDLYESTKSKVTGLIANTKHVAVSIDIWKYMNKDPFITTTVHFIDDSIRYRSFVLTTKKLIANYTAKYLSEVLLDIFQCWKIETKICAIVADCKATIQEAILLLNNIKPIPCIAHCLNTIINNSLRLDLNENNPLADVDFKHYEIIGLIKLCRSIAKHFKLNNVSARLLTEKQKQMNFTVLKLKLDDSSKWNSTLVMMERLLKVKEPLTTVSYSILRCPRMPTPEQWLIMEDLVMLLKPFEMFTLELTQEHRPTLGITMPLIRGLLCSMNNIIPKTSNGKYLMTNLLVNITKIFGTANPTQPIRNCINKNLSCDFYDKPTLLDPRFKKAAFPDSKSTEILVVNDVTEMLKDTKECDTASIDIDTTEEQTDQKVFVNSTDNLLDYLQTNVARLQPICSSTPAQTLIKKYMDLPYLNLLEDPIQFWKTHKSLLGPLSELALKYACIPAMSVPSEIMFFKAGKIESQRRYNLLPKNIDVLIFLNKNLRK